MKNTKQLFLTSLFALVITSLAAQDAKEVAAIKAVIEKESLSFSQLNKKGWEDTWAQVPYAYWSYSDSTGTSFIEGWEGIKKSFEEYFRTSVSSRQIDVSHQATDVKIERKWLSFRIYGNGAYVRYNQKVNDNIDHDETSQVRVMEKKDGKWRVVCVGAIAVYPK